MKLDNIRIESDGTCHGTKIFNKETGEQLENVKRLSIELDAEKCEVKLEFHSEFEYVGPATITDHIVAIIKPDVVDNKKDTERICPKCRVNELIIKMS